MITVSFTGPDAVRALDLLRADNARKEEERVNERARQGDEVRAAVLAAMPARSKTELLTKVQARRSVVCEVLKEHMSAGRIVVTVKGEYLLASGGAK
jgi:hypothetical protein